MSRLRDETLLCQVYIRPDWTNTLIPAGAVRDALGALGLRCLMESLSAQTADGEQVQTYSKVSYAMT